MKTAELFKRCWTAKDVAGLTRVAGAELRSEIAGAGSAEVEKEFSRFTVVKLESADAPITNEEGKELCQINFTALKDGKNQKDFITLVKEQGEWRVHKF